MFTLPDKKTWGPAVWLTMKSFAAGLGPEPDNELQRQALAFYHSLVSLLPCDKCRSSYESLIQKYPPVVSSDTACLNWVNVIEQETNQHIAQQKIQEDIEKLQKPQTQPLKSILKPKGVSDRRQVSKNVPTVKQGSQNPVKVSSANPYVFETVVKNNGYKISAVATTPGQLRALKALALSAKSYTRGCSC